MFIAALFIIATIQKLSKCLLTNEQIKKLWYICAMEYYSAFIKKEVLPSATAWMDLEDVTLSEISWSQKDRY